VPTLTELNIDQYYNLLATLRCHDTTGLVEMWCLQIKKHYYCNWCCNIGVIADGGSW